MNHVPIKLLAAVGTVVASVSLGGCSFLIQTLADPVAERQVKKLNLPTSYAEGFTACLGAAEGKCDVPGNTADAVYASASSSQVKRLLSTRTEEPKIKLLNDDGSRAASNAEADSSVSFSRDGKKKSLNPQQVQVLRSGALAAQRARAVLNSDVQGQLNQIFNSARAGQGSPAADQPGRSGAAPSITIDVGGFSKYMDMIEDATRSDGWEALDREGALFDVPGEDRIRRKYIAAYFRAYFRNGKFYSVKLDGSDLKKKVIARLKDAIPGIPSDGGSDPYDKLAGKLFSELKFDEQGQQFVGKISTEGFVTRGGQEIKLPAVEAELFLANGKVQTSKLDYVAVGSDLIRVLLHAIYDAHDRIPGVSNATGYSLATPLGKQNPDVDAEEIGEIESRAAKVETTVSAGIGRLVRGLGIVALNNEALATAIETSIGVAARKHTEKVMWCWIACKLNEPAQSGDLVATVPDEASLEIIVSGEPSKAIGIARPR